MVRRALDQLHQSARAVHVDRTTSSRVGILGRALDEYLGEKLPPEYSPRRRHSAPRTGIIGSFLAGLEGRPPQVVRQSKVEETPVEETVEEGPAKEYRPDFLRRNRQEGGQRNAEETTETEDDKKKEVTVGRGQPKQITGKKGRAESISSVDDILERRVSYC